MGVVGLFSDFFYRAVGEVKEFKTLSITFDEPRSDVAKKSFVLLRLIKMSTCNYILDSLGQ